MTDVQKAIEILQNSVWTLVDDGLPEKDVKVLITAEGKTSGERIVKISAYTTSYYGLEYWMEPFRYFSDNYRVVAWRPLPEPYREPDE